MLISQASKRGRFRELVLVRNIADDPLEIVWPDCKQCSASAKRCSASAGQKKHPVNCRSLIYEQNVIASRLLLETQGTWNHLRQRTLFR